MPAPRTWGECPIGVTGLFALAVHAGFVALLPGAAPDAPASQVEASLLWIATAPSASAQPGAVAEAGPPAAERATPPARSSRTVPGSRSRPKARRTAARDAGETRPALAAVPAPAASVAAAAGDAATGATVAPSDGTSPSASATPPGGAGGAPGGAESADGGGAGSGELMRTPRLLASGDPCAGYFPADAAAPRGEVRIRALVDAVGHAQSSQVLAARPLGQGFDRAARACVSRLRFRPALDRRGLATAGHATLQIRFVRR